MILLPSDTKIVSYHDTYLKDATGKIVAQTNWWIGESDKNRILRLKTWNFKIFLMGIGEEIYKIFKSLCNHYEFFKIKKCKYFLNKK